MPVSGGFETARFRAAKLEMWTFILDAKTNGLAPDANLSTLPSAEREESCKEEVWRCASKFVESCCGLSQKLLEFACSGSGVRLS